MGIAPLTEAEYETWLAPAKVIKNLEDHLDFGEAVDEIYRRICAGEILTVARTAYWHKYGGFDIHDCAPVGAFLWSYNRRPDFDALVWKTGTHTFLRPEHGSTKEYKVECFGIRLRPDDVAVILRDSGVGEAVVQTAPIKPADKAKPNLPVNEANKFCEFLLNGWPDMTERTAHQRASGFYNEYKVPRDWFWGIFRAKRGPKNPGKQPIPRQ